MKRKTYDVQVFHSLRSQELTVVASCTGFQRAPNPFSNDYDRYHGEAECEINSLEVYEDLDDGGERKFPKEEIDSIDSSEMELIEKKVAQAFFNDLRDEMD